MPVELLAQSDELVIGLDGLRLVVGAPGEAVGAGSGPERGAAVVLDVGRRQPEQDRRRAEQADRPPAVLARAGEAVGRGGG